MADIKQLLAIQRHNKSKFQSFDFERLIIRDGNTKFRITDDMPYIVFEHWFTAADGTPVHSICTRDYEGERVREEEAKPCRICNLVKDAWEIWNHSEEYTEEEVFDAGVIIGKQSDRKKGFPSSWGAKQFAYLNVIDRDGEWCAKNSHTKVLCKSEKQAGISSGEKGQLDEFIECVDENGNWLLYDIRVKKTGKKLDTVYRVYKDKEFDIPEEEDAYDSYNFAEILQPTKAETIERWLTEGVKKKNTSDDEDEDEKSKGKSKKAAKKRPEPAPSVDEEEGTVDEEEEAEPEKVKPKAKPKRPEPAAKKKKTLSLKKKSEPEPEPELDEEEEEEEEEEAPPPKKKEKAKAKAKGKAKEPEPVPDDDIEFECPTCENLIVGDVEACDKCGTTFDGWEEDGEEDGEEEG